MRDVSYEFHRSNNSILSTAKILFTHLKIKSAPLPLVSQCGKNTGVIGSRIKGVLFAAQVNVGDRLAFTVPTDFFDAIPGDTVFYLTKPSFRSASLPASSTLMCFRSSLPYFCVGTVPTGL